MFKRFSLAFVGASAVTAVLILGMNEVAQYFERPDSQLYMRVMDFIPGSGARRRPNLPMPAAQPERARVDPDAIEPEPTEPGAQLDFDQPTQRIDVRIDLEQPASESR